MLEHFEAVEADFQAHYGVDLRDALWGPRPVGVRRLLSLINGLPLRGAVHREAATDGRDWGTVEELLATVVELLDFGNRIRFASGARQGTKIWDPIEVRRPYDAEKKAPEPPKKASMAELARAFGDAMVVEGAEI